MYVNKRLLALMRTIGSPLATNNSRTYVGRSGYDQELYSIAEVNKIPLLYLNTISPEEREKISSYNYHRTRLRRLLEVTAEISALLERRGINYAIFKTLRPYPENVADIDVLNMGSCDDYRKMVEILEESGYLLMEKGAYCTTFQDYKTRFKTGLMIDIYDEISVSHLIYLDKRKLSNYVVEKKLSMGSAVRVFSPEAELLATIAHAALKENQYILAEYCATLHYLALMDQNSIESLVNLIEETNLIYASRWHLSITVALYKLAFNFIPKRLSHLLFRLGGPLSEVYNHVFSSGLPPYKCSSVKLLGILREKLQDSMFRRSLCVQMFALQTKVFAKRFLMRVTVLLQ